MDEKAIYLHDAYTREFESSVKEVNGKFIVLEKSAFYPNGGGQLNDVGVLIRKSDNRQFNVVYVAKISGEISHEVDSEGLNKGDAVKGVIDWNRRYMLMRSHTAAHILSAIFHKEAGALITGNQLDIDKIRIDFSLENFDREKIQLYINKANEVIAKNLPIRSYEVSREEIEKRPEMTKLAKGFPEGMNVFRIIEITGFDVQADGGTHVKHLKEVGKIEFLKAENKGKANRRVYFRLVG